ncbi:MAG TPA: F0F1 ATP synthase subunit A [Epsilonproteobacteria bacterium]|nr:F0F1 ATP synthase subunit A [Campylobacterota bacterium]
MEGIFTYVGLVVDHHHSPVLFFIIQSLIVAAIVLFIAKTATKSLKAVPTGTQNVMETYVSGVISMGTDVLGAENARKYLPLIATLGLFIFTSNMIGIIPGFESPTSNINITLTLALIVFFYYNFEGIRKNGIVDYFAHFMGPVKWLAPLMFPIEIISHLSRIVSLSFRLFGSIRGDDMFLWVLLMLTPWIVPLAPFFLLTVMGVLQTFVFMILTFVYLAGAVAIEEDH